jgi:hypothetical protein
MHSTSFFLYDLPNDPVHCVVHSLPNSLYTQRAVLEESVHDWNAAPRMTPDVHRYDWGDLVINPLSHNLT